MATKTLTELQTEALGILTGLDPNQEPSAEDLQTIGAYVGPLVEQLSADTIIDIADTDAIPEAVFLPLARLLANVAAPRFGSQINDQARVIDERTLRRIASTRPTFETQRAEYF